MKNKPERFLYLAEAVPEVMASKRILLEQGLSEQMDLKRLEISREIFLTVSYIYSSVADSDPWNPYSFPGSGSVSKIAWIRIQKNPSKTENNF